MFKNLIRLYLLVPRFIVSSTTIERRFNSPTNYFRSRKASITSYYSKYYYSNKVNEDRLTKIKAKRINKIVRYTYYIY